jgi:hypothetical protein
MHIITNTTTTIIHHGIITGRMAYMCNATTIHRPCRHIMLILTGTRRRGPVFGWDFDVTRVDAIRDSRNRGDGFSDSR